MPREALPDHYAVLGVPSDADPAAIKAAFRLRALATHPDKPGGTDEAFRWVMQAFTVLFSERAAYDAERAARAAEPPAEDEKSKPPPGAIISFYSYSCRSTLAQSNPKTNGKVITDSNHQ